MLGCGHEGADPDLEPYAQAHNWHTGLPAPFGTTFTTIMWSYYSLENNHVRTLHYSNPNVYRDGHQTGSSTANNARVFSDNGWIVMLHREPAFAVSISGNDYAAYGEPLSYYAEIDHAGVEPYSYSWTCSHGSPSSDSYYSLTFPQVELVTLSLSVTDANNQPAGAYKYINANGLYWLRVAEEKTRQESAVRAAIFPNPASSSLAYNAKFDHSNQVNITIIDARGTNLIELTGQSTNDGEITGNINIGSLSTGVYLIRMRSGSSLIVERFVKQ